MSDKQPKCLGEKKNLVTVSHTRMMKY